MFFLEFPCFFYYPVYVGNLIIGSSVFSKSNLYVWKFLIHVLLKPSLKDIEHYLVYLNEAMNQAVQGEGNGKPPQYSCLKNPVNCMKRHKDMTPEDEPPRLIGVQYATGEEQRNSSRKNEVAGPKCKRHLVVDASSGESKV